LIFLKYDIEKSGVFTKTQFQHVLKSSLQRDNKKVCDSVIQRLVGMIDSNHNGMIDRQEIINFYRRLH
jgi:Ca2+-binding EF-hand superfamily protein